jgi:hypothetical protein
VPGKTSQLLYESFYSPEAKKAKLDRRDGIFVWAIKHDGLEAIFEQSSRFMSEINLTDIEVGIKTEGKQTFGGSYLLPKSFYLMDSGIRKYKIDLVGYENFKDSKKQYIQRSEDFIKHAQKLGRTAVANNFPAFLLR